MEITEDVFSQFLKYVKEIQSEKTKQYHIKQKPPKTIWAKKKKNLKSTKRIPDNNGLAMMGCGYITLSFQDICVRNGGQGATN